MLDLERAEHAYLLGFLLGDGTLYRGPGRKGRLSIEVSRRDESLLVALAPLLPGGMLTRRRRSTNFVDDAESSVLSWCREEVRSAVAAAGMPEGRKDRLIAPPRLAHSTRDVARGYFDADGSLGFTARGVPFLSIVTKSSDMAEWWVDLLAVHAAVHRTCRPNARDGVANVMVQSEPAMAMAAWLYRAGDLALLRKQQKAQEMQAWSRPLGMRAPSRPRRWTAEEDLLVVSDRPVAETAALLRRSESSVVTRRWRLRLGT